MRSVPFVPAQLFGPVLKKNGLPQPVAELTFAKPRRWRFDYAWPDLKIALEVEGGVWTRGRHTRGSGFLKDCQKYNEAAIRGWMVLRTTPRDLLTAETMEMLRRAITARAA